MHEHRTKLKRTDVGAWIRAGGAGEGLLAGVRALVPREVGVGLEGGNRSSEQKDNWTLLSLNKLKIKSIVWTSTNLKKFEVCSEFRLTYFSWSFVIWFNWLISIGFVHLTLIPWRRRGSRRSRSRRRGSRRCACAGARSAASCPSTGTGRSGICGTRWKPPIGPAVLCTL